MLKLTFILIILIILLVTPIKYFFSKEFLQLFINLLLVVVSIILFRFIRSFFDIQFDYFVFLCEATIPILMYFISKYINKTFEDNKCKISFYFMDEWIAKKQIYKTQKDDSVSCLNKNIGYLTIHYCIKTHNIQQKYLDNCQLSIEIEGTDNLTFQKSEQYSEYQQLEKITDTKEKLLMPLLKIGNNVERVGNFKIILNDGDISSIKLHVNIEKNSKLLNLLFYKNRIQFNSNVKHINIT